MKKYNKPTLTIEEIQLSNIITLSDTFGNINNDISNPGDQNVDFDNFWN